MNTRNDIENIKSFLCGLFRSDSIKQTVIMFYSVIALSIFWYWPTPSPFRDSLGNRCVPSIRSTGELLQNNMKAAFSNNIANVPQNKLNDSSNIHAFASQNNFEENSRNVKENLTRKKVLTDPNLSKNEITWTQFLWGNQKFIVAFVFMGLIPILIVKFFFHEKLSDYGVQWGIPGRTFKNVLLLVPLMLFLGIVSGRETSFYSVYPYNPYAFASITFFITHSFLYLFLYYFSWEFMFRGFIQHGLENSMSATNAIWIQVLLSTMLHYGHPISEVIGCIGGGLLWGFLVYRTNSIISGWIQHAILGIALDASLIWYAIH